MVRESKCLVDQNAWIKIAEESLGLDEKLLWKRNCGSWNTYLLGSWYALPHLLIPPWICMCPRPRQTSSRPCGLSSPLTWNATVLPIFNPAFYNPFLFTPQADSHILGGYSISSFAFCALRVHKNRQDQKVALGKSRPVCQVRCFASEWHSTSPHHPFSTLSSFLYYFLSFSSKSSTTR